MENNDEQAKQQQQGRKQLSFDQLDQVDSDHAFAIALQQQVFFLCFFNVTLVLINASVVFD